MIAVIGAVGTRKRTSHRHGSYAASLSIVVMTRQPARTAALLEQIRGVADEIVVALDDRAEGESGALDGIADRVVVYQFLDPVDRPLPWLVRQARCEWVLALDDDEVPSATLLRELPALCSARDVFHYSIARRWLHPRIDTYLDESPWRPDYQLRLFRVGTPLVTFSDDFHRPLVASGPGRFVQQPLWHLDTATSSYENRLEKIRRYERMRPGVRVEGRAINAAFYLPEARPDLTLARVPVEELRLLEQVVAGSVKPRAPRAHHERVTREEIDEVWPSGTIEGGLELIDRSATVIAGSQRTLDVRVHNTGTRRWSGGPDAVPSVYVEVQWEDRERTKISGSTVWTPLPGPIEAHASDHVPVHIRAPTAAGGYTVAIRLVRDGVGRFGTEILIPVRVIPGRRFAVLAEETDIELLASFLERLSEAEPVVLTRTPTFGGYLEAPDARSYLFTAQGTGRLAFGSALGARTILLLLAAIAHPRISRPGPGAFLDTLASCRVLMVSPAEGTTSRRDRWARLMTIVSARLLHVPVTDDPEVAMRLLEGE